MRHGTSPTPCDQNRPVIQSLTGLSSSEHSSHQGLSVLASAYRLEGFAEQRMEEGFVGIAEGGLAVVE